MARKKELAGGKGGGEGGGAGEGAGGWLLPNNTADGEPGDKIDSRVWRINGPKQIAKVILCCGWYRDGNRPGRHGNAAGSFGGFNSQTDGRTPPPQKRSFALSSLRSEIARVQR